MQFSPVCYFFLLAPAILLFTFVPYTVSQWLSPREFDKVEIFMYIICDMCTLSVFNGRLVATWCLLLPAYVYAPDCMLLDPSCILCVVTKLWNPKMYYLFARASKLWTGQSGVWVPVGARDLSLLPDFKTGSGAHSRSWVLSLAGPWGRPLASI